MLEWYVQIGRNWECRAGAVGKGMKKLLNENTWIELTKTFTGAGIDENWDALFKTIDFFRRIAVEVANDLSYEYLYSLDNKMSNYLRKIKDLER